MNLERYPYYANPSFFDFEFESEGPKGTIKKIARFSTIGTNLYNFGFGDLDEATGDISDDVVTNNGDGEKVLATVAGIIWRLFHSSPIFDHFRYNLFNRLIFFRKFATCLQRKKRIKKSQKSEGLPQRSRLAQAIGDQAITSSC